MPSLGTRAFVLIQNERTKEKIKTSFPPFAKGKFLSCKKHYKLLDFFAYSELSNLLYAFFTSPKTGVNEVGLLSLIIKKLK